MPPTAGGSLCGWPISRCRKPSMSASCAVRHSAKGLKPRSPGSPSARRFRETCTTERWLGSGVSVPDGKARWPPDGRLSPGDVQDLKLRQPDRPDAEIIGEHAERLGLDQVAVRDFGKAKSAAM